MYKLLALDLDGTLLRGDGSIEASDRRAIDKVRASGVVVSIVTGRLYGGTRPVAEELGLYGPHVCVDGAVIRSFPEDDAIHEATIMGEAAELVRREAGRDGVAVLAVMRDSVILDSRSAAFEPQISHMTPRVEHVERVLDHPDWESHGASSLVAIGLTDIIKGVEDPLREHPDIGVVRHDLPRATGISSLIVHARGVSKGAGVLRLAAHYGCTAAEVVAVGDWFNDISMFAVAGRSFAMSGAPEEVSEAASERLTADVLEGGGIAEAVARAWPDLD